MHGLVLSGGGAKGDVEAGALAAIVSAYESTQQPIVALSGTSVGSLNAAGCAAVNHWFPMELWHGITSADVYRSSKWAVPWRLWKQSAMYDSAPLRDFIARHLSAENLHGSDYQLFVHATRLSNKQPVIFTHESPDILTGIYASSSVPGAFPPVLWKGSWLVDGGVVDNSPIRSLIRYGCDKITVIYLDSDLPAAPAWADAVQETEPAEARPSAGRVVADSIEAMMDAHFRRDMKNVALVNETVVGNVGDLGHRAIDLRVWGPSGDLGGTLDFDLATSGARAETAYHDALRWVMPDARRFSW